MNRIEQFKTEHADYWRAIDEGRRVRPPDGELAFSEIRRLVWNDWTRDELVALVEYVIAEYDREKEEASAAP